MKHMLPDKITISLSDANKTEIQKRDDAQFQTEIDQLTREGEALRLRFMTQQKTRKMVALWVTIICVTVGMAAFGYLFLMRGAFVFGVGVLLLSFIPPIFPHIWASFPPKRYKKAYKDEFLPKLARSFGGLKYFPSRGVSEKVVRRTGVLPSFSSYEAEDCFAGQYKGVKVILSEARMRHANKKGFVFDGLLVLLEIPSAILEGHTIITADIDRAQRWAQTRWKKLSPVEVNVENKQANRFKIFSDKPEAASLLVGERLLKELAEMGDIFGDLPVSAALFKEKYVFLAIPCADDMFEAADIEVPIATSSHAVRCKKEVEKIMEVIDLFELFSVNI